MKATKLVIGASLLIALVGVAPSAAAEPVQDCSAYLDNIDGENEDEPTPQGCIMTQEGICAGAFLPLAPHQYLLCLVGLN